MHGGDTPLHQAAPDGFSRVESGSKENFTEITSISFKFRLMTPMKIRRLCSIPCFRCFGMFTIAPGQRGCSPGYQGWEKNRPPMQLHVLLYNPQSWGKVSWQNTGLILCLRWLTSQRVVLRQRLQGREGKRAEHLGRSYKSSKVAMNYDFYMQGRAETPCHRPC